MSAIPSDDYMEKLFGQEVRMSMQVGLSLRMLAECAKRVEQGDDFTYLACIDLFLVHARLLCEFLLVHPSGHPNDFSAKDFYMSEEGWIGPTDKQTALVGSLWTIASEQVVHFSKNRAPAKLSDIEPFELNSRKFTELAERIYILFDSFLSHAKANGSRESATLESRFNMAKAILGGAKADSISVIPPMND